jgi:hypothetical protein
MKKDLSRTWMVAIDIWGWSFRTGLFRLAPVMKPTRTFPGDLMSLGIQFTERTSNATAKEVYGKIQMGKQMARGFPNLCQ